MPRMRALAALLLAAACNAWPPPPPMSPEAHLADFTAWRSGRRDALVRPGSGAVTWTGLWEIPDGRYRVGADTSLEIVLPGRAVPRIAGVLEHRDTLLTFTPERRAAILTADSVRVRGTVALVTDRSPSSTVLAIGSARFRIHGEPGTNRLWVRAWDEDHPARATFQLPDTYPLSGEWRVAARFDSFPSPRDIQVADVADGTQVYHSPGALTFEVGGRRHTLAVSADARSRDYFIMLWDSTAAVDTYGAGRYLRVPLADSTGWTVIDFNRTYNPPCAFTAYSTCAFPPAENRLPFAIPAGEKRVR